MKKSVKATLLSLLLYPGAGHIFLKKYKLGFVLVGVFSVPLLLLVGDIVNKTNQVIARIESGDIPADIVAITHAASNITSGPEAQTMNVNIYIMGAVWLISALHAYCIGKSIDKSL
ncbi:MAG: hypothetical protein GY951_00170 [Psychromonas sp.]|nr:hypothetical protein [Psychromonas sp.]